MFVNRRGDSTSRRNPGASGYMENEETEETTRLVSINLVTLTAANPVSFLTCHRFGKQGKNKHFVFPFLSLRVPARFPTALPIRVSQTCFSRRGIHVNFLFPSLDHLCNFDCTPNNREREIDHTGCKPWVQQQKMGENSSDQKSKKTCNGRHML